MPIVVRANNFVEEVLETQGPVLVDFFGENCMPCKMLQPILAELCQDFSGFKLCMLNTDREMNESDAEYEEKFKIIAAYEIMNLPTLMLFVDGEVRASTIGMQTRKELLAFFSKQNISLTPRPL